MLNFPKSLDKYKKEWYNDCEYIHVFFSSKKEPVHGRYHTHSSVAQLCRQPCFDYG